MDYPPAAVEQTTRTLFPNYFNGSEIVIAGKLADSSAEQLHVEVTASNSKKFVILKTDVPVGPREAGNGVVGSTRPEGGGAGGPKHVERLWGYLTVRELLSSWLHGGDGPEKERARQKAQALAVAYRFLTPLTAMHLQRSALRLDQPGDALGTAAAAGPEALVQSLRGASPQPGEQPPGRRVHCRGPLLSLPGSDHAVPGLQRLSYTPGSAWWQKVDL